MKTIGDIHIAGSLTTDDWKTFRATLAPAGDMTSWDKAFVDYFLGRLVGLSRQNQRLVRFVPARLKRSGAPALVTVVLAPHLKCSSSWMHGYDVIKGVRE